MIKRFLNAFGIRRYIAEARGITVDPSVLAKLVILEERYPDAFDALVSRDWSEQKRLMESWEEWAKQEGGDPPEGSLDGTKAWAAAEPSLVNRELGPYLTLAASLASRTIRLAISEELAALVLRMVGESDADRELAYEQALQKSPDERRQVVLELFEQLRRADDLSRPTKACIAIAEGDAILATDIAGQFRTLDFSLITPALAVAIVGSSAGALKGLSADLLADSRVTEPTKAAIREIIE